MRLETLFLRRVFTAFLICSALAVADCLLCSTSYADSVNSPNITLNVDTNRAVGAGAGNVAVTISTITLAEITLPEYNSGGTNRITIQARPGFQFDPASNVSALSATIGFNGAAANTPSILTPSGSADESLVFNFTSGTSATVQDIIRISGIQLKILSAAGAAGPAQTTLQVTTSTAGGAFTNQGIVAANIARGAPDRLVFSIQPGSNQAGADLLPAVTIVDFGGNVVPNDPRTISLAIQTNPGGATLQGDTQLTTSNGIAAWSDGDNLRIGTADEGYTLRATHSGAAFLTSDTVDSESFDITAGAPARMVISRQPADTVAGEPILIDVSLQDNLGNAVTTTGVGIRLDSAINPGGWPLLVDTSLFKPTVDGVASWGVADNLRINRQLTDYQLVASGTGAPATSAAFDITPGAPSRLVFTEQPSDEAAGASINLTVEARDEFENVATNTVVAVTLSLSTNPGNATLLSTSGLTKNTSNGVAEWNDADGLRVTVADAGYQIAASGTSVGGSAESDPFDITAGAPAALAFVQEPGDTEVNTNIAPPVTVAVNDAFGNRTQATAAVTLSVLSACGGAVSGAQATSASGLATFAALRIDTACEDTSLRAESAGVTSALSESFEVTEDNAPPPVAPPCGAGVANTLATLLVIVPLVRLGRGRQIRHVRQ